MTHDNIPLLLHDELNGSLQAKKQLKLYIWFESILNSKNGRRQALRECVLHLTHTQTTVHRSNSVTPNITIGFYIALDGCRTDTHGMSLLQ